MRPPFLLRASYHSTVLFGLLGPSAYALLSGLVPMHPVQMHPFMILLFLNSTIAVLFAGAVAGHFFWIAWARYLYSADAMRTIIDEEKLFVRASYKFLDFLEAGSTSH